MPGVDLGHQRRRQRMLRRFGDVGLQRLLGELAVVGVERVTGIGIGHSECRRVLLEGLREGDPRRFALAGDIGDQRAVIALIELRPVGVAQAIEGGERLIGLAGSLLHPGARQDRGQIGDRALARRGEMLVGLLVVALLEGLAAEQELRDAMRRLDLDQLAGELDGVVPIGRGGLEQEGLLEDQLVVGILGERPANRSLLPRQYRGRRAQRAPRDNCRAECRARRFRLRSRPPPNRPLERRGWPRQRETSAPICGRRQFRHLACAIRLGAAPNIAVR